MKKLRTLLNQVVSETLPQEPVALLFSGGTDSLSILWTLLDLKAQVTCYTFHLSYFISDDARASRMACNYWKIPQIMVNEDNREKEDQLQDIICTIHSFRKTHVEVMYGYYFLMQAVKENHVYSGIQADSLYGSNKNGAIRMGKKSAEEFTRYRQDLVSNPDQEGLKQAGMVADHFHRTLHTPYSDPRIRDFFYQYNWKELNQPKQKMPAILSFEKEFRELPIYRHDDNFQCGSHLREHLSEYVRDYRRIYDRTCG